MAKNNNSNSQHLSSNHLTNQSDNLPILSFLKKGKTTRKPLQSRQYDQQNCNFQVEVLNYKIVEHEFTMYSIKITYGSLYWIFQSRYSLLETLNSKLSKETMKKVEKFPPKKLFGNQEESFIQKRKVEIDKYLKSLFKYGKQDKVVESFIRQSQKAAIEINDPCELKYFKLDAQ